MNSVARGPFSLWLYFPKLPEISISGSALKASKRTEFVTLNTSHENAKFCRSVIFQVFRSAESIVK
jgi:hypothetical protein